MNTEDNESLEYANERQIGVCMDKLIRKRDSLWSLLRALNDWGSGKFIDGQGGHHVSGSRWGAFLEAELAVVKGEIRGLVEQLDDIINGRRSAVAAVDKMMCEPDAMRGSDPSAGRRTIGEMQEEISKVTEAPIVSLNRRFAELVALVDSLEDNVADHEREIDAMKRWFPLPRAGDVRGYSFKGEKKADSEIKGVHSPEQWGRVLQMMIPESSGAKVSVTNDMIVVVQDGAAKVGSYKPWENWTPLEFYVHHVADKIEHGEKVERGAGDDYPVQDYGHDKVSPV